MEIRYFGWSGVTVAHGNALVAFDIPGEAGWRAPLTPFRTVFCVTHGHLEHCSSMPGLEKRAGEGRFDLISSVPVIEYARKVSLLSAVQMHALAGEEVIDLDGTVVTAIAWEHMALLPPGLPAKVRHLAHLASRPLDLIRIVAGGSKPPRHAPTLGFHVKFPDGKTLLNYSEGLHRHADESGVRRIAANFPADILLAAVEPEDAGILPKWIGILKPKEVFLYEAHRLWREKFKMSCLDLESYVRKISGRLKGIRFHSLSPGQTTLL